MTSNPRTRRAVIRAAQLIQDARIRDPKEIDVELIAVYFCNTLVEYDDLNDAEGILLRTGNRGIITVDNSSRATYKWRFVIAHELGHFILHEDTNQLAVCTDANMHDWYREGHDEPQANDFAAELLMPEVLFRPQCDRDRPSLDDVRELSKRFRTSLSATGLRFVKMSPEPCAIVSSSNGRIDWWASSEDFGFTLRRGYTLSTSCYAGDLFAGKMVDDRPQLVDASAWSNDSRSMDLEVREHSMMLGKYQTVLSFLWHPYR